MKESQSEATLLVIDRKGIARSDSFKSLTVKRIGSSPGKSPDKNIPPLVMKKASLNMLLKPVKIPDDNMLGLRDEPPNKPKEEI